MSDKTGNPKFEFTGEEKVIFGVTLKRIRAKVAFGIVAKGEQGGWVEFERNVDVSGNAWVSGDAWVSGNAWVYGNARVSGNAWVYGDARVSGNAWVSGNARVQSPADIQTYSGVGSEYGTLTVYKTKDGLELTRECFHGSLEQFRAAVIDKHGESSKIGCSYLAICNLIEHWFDVQPASKEEAAT